MARLPERQYRLISRVTRVMALPAWRRLGAVAFALALLLSGLSAPRVAAISGYLDFTISGGLHHQVGDSITIQPTGSYTFAPYTGYGECAYVLTLGGGQSNSVLGSGSNIQEIIRPDGDTCPPWTFTLPNLADMGYWPEGSATSIIVEMGLIDGACNETCLLAASNGIAITYAPSSASVMPASSLPVVLWSLDHDPVANGDQGTLTVTEVGFGDRLHFCSGTFWYEPTPIYADQPACADVAFEMSNGVVNVNLDDLTERVEGDAWSSLEADSNVEIPSADTLTWSPPSAPVDVSATAGNGRATVSWGWSPSVTAYTVTSSPGDQTCTSPGGPLWCTVTGLTDGQSYTFTVVASNDFGDSPPSNASNSVIPQTTPSAPMDVTANAGDSQATVSWRAPADDGGSAISAYTVTSSPGGKTCTWSAGPLSCSVNGLTNGQSYTFTVVASNGVGDGPASDPSNSVTPATTPDAPTNVSAVAGNGQAAVSWSAPADNGGSTITAYTATSSPGGKTCTWSAGPLSCSVSGLTNGQSYTFSVVAANGVGDGPASSPSNSVTPAAPADTTPPLVSAPDGYLLAPATLTRTAPFELTWPAASDVSGIDHYELQFKKGSHPWKTVGLDSPTATSALLNLAPGASDRFRLRATDTADNSSAWVTTSTTKLRRVQEKSGAVSYAGGWKSVSLSGASGGHVKKSSSTGATASYTFSGTSVALVTTTGPRYGMVEVWLDGVRQTTLDLYSASRHTQQIVWSPAAPLSAGNHTLQLRVTGTKRPASGGTRVDLDAFLVW